MNVLSCIDGGVLPGVAIRAANAASSSSSGMGSSHALGWAHRCPKQRGWPHATSDAHTSHVHSSEELSVQRYAQPERTVSALPRARLPSKRSVHCRRSASHPVTFGSTLYASRQCCQQQLLVEMATCRRRDICRAAQSQACARYLITSEHVRWHRLQDMLIVRAQEDGRVAGECGGGLGRIRRRQQLLPQLAGLCRALSLRLAPVASASACPDCIRGKVASTCGL